MDSTSNWSRLLPFGTLKLRNNSRHDSHIFLYCWCITASGHQGLLGLLKRKSFFPKLYLGFSNYKMGPLHGNASSVPFTLIPHLRLPWTGMSPLILFYNSRNCPPFYLLSAHCGILTNDLFLLKCHFWIGSHLLSLIITVNYPVDCARYKYSLQHKHLSWNRTKSRPSLKNWGGWQFFHCFTALTSSL